MMGRNAGFWLKGQFSFVLHTMGREAFCDTGVMQEYVRGAFIKGRTSMLWWGRRQASWI